MWTARMLIFLIVGIFLPHKILADEIKIDENGSVHWIRDWREEVKPNIIRAWNKTATFDVLLGNRTELVGVNTQMEYKIGSPLTTSIGSLEKETKIEGCQYIGGCRIVLRFGDGTIFHSEQIMTSIDKIEIDLAEVPQIQELKNKSCESFLINIELALPNHTRRRCIKAYRESFYGRNDSRGGRGEFDRSTNECLVSLGTFEYNLLNSWVEAFSKENILASYEENRVVINMGPAREFSWCGLYNQELSLIMRNYQHFSPLYCKQITDWNFNLVDGKVKIDIENLTGCDDNNTHVDLNPVSVQCVDWEDIEITISLHLDQCHTKLRQTLMPKSLADAYRNACQAHSDTCSWERVEFSGPNQNAYNIRPSSYQCVEKNNTLPSAVISFDNLQPLNATKTTGTISTREEEDTGMIFLSDSEDNLECLKKQVEILSIAPKLSTKEFFFNTNYSIPKTELYPDDCQEHVKTINLKTLSMQTPDFQETFESFLKIGNLSKTQDGKLKFNCLYAKCEKCGALETNLLLMCMNEDDKSIKSISGLEIDSGEITGLQCLATGFLSSSSNLLETFGLRQWTKCFTSEGPGCGW